MRRLKWRTTYEPSAAGEGLGKAYRSYASEWMRVARWFYLPVQASDEHWVLRNINFSLGPGEAVGIVGENGAGKSTLLKMITGTLQPTEGEVILGGRVSAILELGMGFNPELTGRQNARHSAGLMGYGLEQVDAVIGDIEGFCRDRRVLRRARADLLKRHANARRLRRGHRVPTRDIDRG